MRLVALYSERICLSIPTKTHCHERDLLALRVWALNLILRGFTGCVGDGDLKVHSGYIFG